MKLIGVAVDNWKLRPYKRAIKAADFTIKSVNDIKNGTALIAIETDEKGQRKLAALLKSLERKYSQRNRMN